MCGIICIICSKSDASGENLPLNVYEEIEDLLKRRGPDAYKTIKFENDSHSFLFGASVLWLQGQNLNQQPINNDNSVFIYNGDVFGGNLIASDLRRTLGDTSLFLKSLESSQTISTALSEIQGPYAFVYLNKKQMKLYFGRDIFGRRSLLVGKNCNAITLSSVAKKDLGVPFIELPAIGTFCFDLRLGTFEVMPWKYRNQNFPLKLKELEDFLGRHIEISQEINLLEICTYKEPIGDDLNIYNEIRQLNWGEAMQRLLQNENWLKRVKKLEFLLENAVRERISSQPKFCHDCIKTKDAGCNHALTGVLFSGGVDCSVLALLADKFTEKHRQIDLFNVAFDKVKDYKTPDRLTGLETLEELKSIRPDRQWNFVEINITAEELNVERKNHIRHLIYPLNSILDDSLGCALWFASRGKTLTYHSRCRVLLVGMGADELFGGYTRHRSALKRQSWFGLHNSLNEDWQNISVRNLARDDRVVSDHGRQLRTPYLDEEFVEYVRNLSCWEKSCPSEDLPQGFGEKILLRSLAYYLGLKNASQFKKRALQFGSRIANSKENAQDVSPRL